MKGGPFGDIKKICEKSLKKTKKTCTKNFDQGRDSNPRPSAWQILKKLNQPLCQVPAVIASVAVTVSAVKSAQLFITLYKICQFVGL